MCFPFPLRRWPPSDHLGPWCGAPGRQRHTVISPSLAFLPGLNCHRLLQTRKLRAPKSKGASRRKWRLNARQPRMVSSRAMREDGVHEQYEGFQGEATRASTRERDAQTPPETAWATGWQARDTLIRPKVQKPWKSDGGWGSILLSAFCARRYPARRILEGSAQRTEEHDTVAHVRSRFGRRHLEYPAHLLAQRVVLLARAGCPRELCPPRCTAGAGEESRHG